MTLVKLLRQTSFKRTTMNFVVEERDWASLQIQVQEEISKQEAGWRSVGEKSRRGNTKARGFHQEKTSSLTRF